MRYKRLVVFLWIIIVFLQLAAMMKPNWTGLFGLMFVWISIYGVSLYFHMRRNQLDFELREAIRIRDIMVSQMWAFWNSDPYSRSKHKANTIKEKIQLIKENWK